MASVFGIGVGPGDPELLTLKALRLIRAAPVIAYPAPEQGDSLARGIVSSHLPGNQTEIAIRMPLEVARFPAQATFVWDEAANSLPDDSAIDRKATDALLKDVANEAFAARGYRVVDGISANYRLSYQYVIHSYHGPDVSRAVGSISLLLTDYASRQRVWLGYRRAEVYAGLSPEERRARLKDALTRMFEEFPPSQRP